MNFSILVLLCIIKFSFYSFSQSVQVKDFDESEYKSVMGLYSMDFHHSSFNHNDRNVKVFLVEGKYWLFPAGGLNFGGNINLKNAPSEIDLVKKQNHYEFNVEDVGAYDFKISAENSAGKSKELLYVIYKAYNPNKIKFIESFSYKTLDDQKISSDDTDKKYSLIYFTGRKDLIDRGQIESLNSLKNEYKNVQFVCMFSEPENELTSFKEETNFNWSFISSVRSRELAKFQIGKLISEPAIYLVDNDQNKIIYHYYGVYNLPLALKKALKEL
ncbi:hypothetical protein ABWH96_14350 [Marivirga tractuosa]|uniref:TlpA family protein disulfide reductase n=1 Tax=Marivirga tractuosa TaxID=1006 RepID=UPI0035CF8F90